MMVDGGGGVPTRHKPHLKSFTLACSRIWSLWCVLDRVCQCGGGAGTMQCDLFGDGGVGVGGGEDGVCGTARTNTSRSV